MKKPHKFALPELAFYSLIVWCFGMVVAAIVIAESY